MILSYHCINFSLEKDQRRQRSLDLTSSPSSARNKFRNSRKPLESSMLTRMASSPPPTSRPPLWTSAARSRTPRPTTWWARRPGPSTSPRWSRCLQRRWPEVSTALLSSCQQTFKKFHSAQRNLSWDLLLVKSRHEIGLLVHKDHNWRVVWFASIFKDQVCGPFLGTVNSRRFVDSPESPASMLSDLSKWPLTKLAELHI